MAFSKPQMKKLLSIYELTFEYEQDEDGRYAGSIEQIEDIVADGETIDELRLELARQLIEYAIDYKNNYFRYFNSPNRHKHAPYILRVLLEDDIESVERMFMPSWSDPENFLRRDGWVMVRQNGRDKIYEKTKYMSRSSSKS